MLSGESKATRTVKKKNNNRSNEQKSTCSTLFLYISLPLLCTTTTWNFQKLPGYSFYGGNVVRVLHFFSHCRSFSPWWPLAFLIFFTAATKFHVVPPTKNVSFVFLSLALALFLDKLRWPFALLSLFLCLSLSLFSKFVSMTINLNTRIQKNFPLSVFVFIDSLAVSASQDAGSHTFSRQNNLTFGIGLRDMGVRTVGVRTLRHNQISLLS